MLLGVAFAGISIDDYTVTKPVYKPGEPGVATISVSNPLGSERVTSITMTVNSAYELTVTSSPNLADIDSGGSAIVSIPFKVKQDANPGIYTINVFFRGYKMGDSAGTSVTSVNSIAIPITVVNEPEFSFSVDNKLLTGLDDVNLRIVNNGGIAKNVKISIVGPVSLYGADQIYAGEITGEKTIPLSLDSRSANEGVADLLAVLSYQDALGIPHTENATLRMTIRKEQLDILIIPQDKINTRDKSQLTLKVINEGTETISNLRIKFPGDSIKMMDVTELKFGDLLPGQSATKNATIYTELSPGVNLVDSRVEWIEKDVQMEEQRSIALTVTSDADVEVFLEAKPLPLTLGGDHTISVLVSNLGTFSIENVDVAIESPVMKSMDISNKQYIGGLQRDDFSTVQFLMHINATEPGIYPVYLDIHYRDQSGMWMQKKIQKEINIYNGTADEGGSSLPILIGLGVVIVLVWHFKFRKK